MEGNMFYVVLMLPSYCSYFVNTRCSWAWLWMSDPLRTREPRLTPL